jgi:hypothetical protein
MVEWRRGGGHRFAVFVDPQALAQLVDLRLGFAEDERRVTFRRSPRDPDVFDTFTDTV